MTVKPFLGGPSPPEARSPKPESLAGFFGPKIGRISANFRPNFGKIMALIVTKYFFYFFGRKSADFRPISGRICGLDQSLKSLTKKIHISFT